ncbi:hypothetical protein [Streptococcus mitis]|uniref:hypothetical protein n=1 Tax=Streptococcus mitis TaxID=28037 RepID=UPI001C4F92CB
MTTTKNPWNQLSNVDINGEQAILATEDVELIKKYTSTKRYKNLKDDNIYRLQLGFYPQQFVGDIQKADIIILSTNPGYKPEFKTLYDNNKNYQKNLLDNLQLKNTHFHAFDLDTKDFGHWAKKFKKWFDDVENLQDLKEKLPWFSKHVALAEYFPYHSIKYDKKLNTFISKEGYFPTQKFLFDLIRERVLDDNDPVTIIITRAYSEWTNAIPELKTYETCYRSTSPRAASVRARCLLKGDGKAKIYATEEFSETLSKLFKDL